MSLSKEIIKGNYEKVEKLLTEGAPVNIIDEYGYTPLIHAAGMNRYDLASLLIKHHAQVDITDITGSNALLWAIDNNNYEMCKLFLELGANPNSYTSNGQPSLFYPLLRKNSQLTNLLIKHGANLDYAKDFINAKLIGHRFELIGRTDVLTPEGLFVSIDLEGFYLEFTLALIRESLEKFIRSYIAHREDIHENELKEIIKAYENASKLREFKHFSKNVQENKNKIFPLLKRDLLLLPVSYMSHAINFIQHRDFLAKCDRGVQKMTDPIVIYNVGNKEKLNQFFLLELLFKAHTQRSIKVDLHQALSLSPYANLPIKHQITGNCSWANTESAVPTMLYMLLHDKLKDRSKADALVGEIMTFYHTWLEWDKDRALEDCLEGFNTMSFNRQRAKASLLGAVLFQACNPNKPGDVARAKKILKILSQKEFHFIVRIYANVFIHGKGSSYGKSFQTLIEQCGYKLSQFTG